MTGWVRSSFCSGNGECIEVRRIKPGNDDKWVAVRRTLKGREVWQEIVTGGEWDAFIAGVKAGEFDHLTGDTPA